MKEWAHKTGLNCICLIKKVVGDWKVNSNQGSILKSISTVYLQFTAGKVCVENKCNGHLFLVVKLRSVAVFKSKIQPQKIYHVSFKINLFPAAANKVWNAESNFVHVKCKSDIQWQLFNFPWSSLCVIGILLQESPWSEIIILQHTPNTWPGPVSSALSALGFQDVCWLAPSFTQHSDKR